MNNYEGVFVVDPELNQENQDKVEALIKDTISKQNGVVENVEKWGKRRLAYRVKKRREGYYYLINFKAEPKDIINLEKTYKLNESIIKLMIVKK